jgi:hypothetical protein
MGQIATIQPDASLADRAAAGLNRHTDVAITSLQTKPLSLPSLPSVNWNAIGQQAPTRIPIGSRHPEDPLPTADWVVITWTNAEWQALDHVFLNSSHEGNSTNFDWKKDWFQYSRSTANYGNNALAGDLWGLFQLVEIIDQSKRPWRVLLFKSNTHLAHAPWAAGLSTMLQCILTDTKADRVYTIGTAGGARLNQCLGDTIITNTATLELQRPENIVDPGNGHAFRCPSWYPAATLIPIVQENLLLKLDTVATPAFLGELFDQLLAKHAGDPSAATLHIEDLQNDAIAPACLHTPKIQSLEDTPLLSTDFYAVATEDSTASFAFLEMDDAIIGKAANALSVRFACIRNISDPVVPDKTRSGATIPDTIRGDWSGLIYNSFGLYTSFNGALATWATIAGEGTPTYHPARFTEAPDKDDPIEVKLVYQVLSCGTCKFFWPDDKHQAPYGPYSAFDFDVNFPYEAARPSGAATAPWTLGRTRPPAFPNAEVIDGCRKSPIMTIGINPCLTAFSPGQSGTACAYPNFASDNNTDAWTKYAWYYRYRTVYQEKISFDLAEKFMLPEGQIIALHDGKIVSATRADNNPSWSIAIRYAGFPSDTIITLPGTTGDFPYMLFFDTHAPYNSFKAGDVLAGKVAVPEGIQAEVLQQEQGYYTQFVPTLKKFEDYLRSKGHPNASLLYGEDVSALDMVACASPHWSEEFLGSQMQTIVDNCTTRNAWVVKQFVQSRPAVLFIVSEASWDMFNRVFGKFVDPGKISASPADQSYTLLRETTKPDDPVYVSFDLTIDGIPYKSKTRLVITPHFSYNTNFYPQYRLSPQDLAAVSALPEFQTAITPANGFTIMDADPAHPLYYREIQLQPSTAAASRAKLLQDHPGLYNRMEPYYYDANELMASVLMKMYEAGDLTYDDAKRYLGRTDGACRFCVNRHWQFPEGCKYGKNNEPAPPQDFLEKVAAYIVAK